MILKRLIRNFPKESFVLYQKGPRIDRFWGGLVQQKLGRAAACAGTSPLLDLPIENVVVIPGLVFGAFRRAKDASLGRSASLGACDPSEVLWRAREVANLPSPDAPGEHGAFPSRTPGSFRGILMSSLTGRAESFRIEVLGGQMGGRACSRYC